MADKTTSGFYLGDIEGIEEARRILDGIKPKLHAELIARMKSVAEDVAADINRQMPNDAPMSGFDHAGATSWAKKGEASTRPQGTRVNDAMQEWPVYKISLGGYASAVCDIAGAGSRGVTPQGIQMVAMLNSREGRASRWVWPTADKHKGRVERNMQQACDAVEEEQSRRLALSAGG